MNPSVGAIHELPPVDGLDDLTIDESSSASATPDLFLLEKE
jgi:hypothetical protein